MMRKLCALLLALVLAVTVLPAPVQLTAQAAGESAAMTEDTLRPLVEQQVKAYAKSIAVKNSGDEAAEILVRHSMFKGGKTLKAGEGSALTAALVNAEMTQELLTWGLSGIIRLMYELNEPVLYANGGLNWHSDQNNYSLAAYRTEQKDENSRIKQVASTGTSAYQGPLNQNDQAMVWVVGSAQVEAVVTRVPTDRQTAMYQVALKISDSFDFTGNPKDAGEYANGSSLSDLLTILGSGMNGVILHTFDWQIEFGFQVEVPWGSCSHTGANYHWSYDAEDRRLITVEGDGFARNRAQQVYWRALPTETDPDPVERYYHKLETPVRLLHDQPWVLEYQMQGASKIFALAATDVSDCYPYLIKWGKDYAFAAQYERNRLTAGQVAEPAYRIHYYGAKLQLPGYSNRYTYTFRYENRVAEDGSNRIWVSVYNNDLQRLEQEAVPMLSYYLRQFYDGVSSSPLVDQQVAADWISGKDFIINYVGNRNYWLDADAFELTIWENGEGAETQSCFVTTYKAPTCTEQGGNVHTCTRCGYSEFLTVEPALGHSYGEYISDDNAQCEKDSTKTAACTVCKKTKTVTEPGTALAHQWKEATCDTLKHCTLCYKTVGSALGHSIEVIPEQPPTCTKMGFTAGEWCSVCETMVTLRTVVKATGHSDNNGDDWCDACALWMGKGEAPAPTPAPTPDQPTRTPGDVNGDEEVNNKDATRLFQYLSGWDVEAVAEVLDVNGDGEVNNKDATRLFQYLSGWDVEIF